MAEQNNKNCIIDYIPTVKGGILYRFFKRFFDFMAALLGLIIFSPLMVIVAILVSISQRGRCFYVDKRVGKNGKQIGVLKFPTMRRGSGEHPEVFLSKKQQKEYERERRVEDDPRVTPSAIYRTRQRISKIRASGSISTRSVLKGTTLKEVGFFNETV